MFFVHSQLTRRLTELRYDLEIAKRLQANQEQAITSLHQQLKERLEALQQSLLQVKQVCAGLGATCVLYTDWQWWKHCTDQQCRTTPTYSGIRSFWHHSPLLNTQENKFILLLKVNSLLYVNVGWKDWSFLSSLHTQLKHEGEKEQGILKHRIYQLENELSQSVPRTAADQTSAQLAATTAKYRSLLQAQSLMVCYTLWFILQKTNNYNQILIWMSVVYMFCNNYENIHIKQQEGLWKQDQQ